MKKWTLNLNRHSPVYFSGYLLLTALVICGLLLFAVNQVKATANNYNRSIKMSSAKPSAAATTYTVTFTVDSSYSLRTFVVDFCSNSPLAGQSCTAPTGFTVGVSPTVSNLLINGSTPGGTWTATSLNSGRTLVYSGSAGTAVVAGNVVTFDVTSVVNPSTIGSFYGRILTYSIASPSYSATATDVFEEFGGTALSTASSIGFVFQIPETLQFCVYKTTCGDNPALALGHGANNVLDSTQIDTAVAKLSVATNAQGGVTIFGYGSSLKIPGKTIAPINGGTGVQAAMTAGTEAFGFKISPTTGAIAAGTCYADTGGNDYCFDNNMVPPITTGVAVTQQSSPGPINNSVLTVTFAATASTSTPAGIYTTVISFVASATF